jgi:hypothetical protein
MANVMHKIVLALIIFAHTNKFTNASSVTYSRGDKNAYLTARKSNFDIDPLHSRNPKSKSDTRNYDDPNPCTTYLAPSSIPNAGLGIYTSIPLPAKTLIGSSQIGILLQDPDHHNPRRSYEFDLLTNYVWSATPLTHGVHEVSYGESICVGIGMMANCHYGLINVDHIHDWKYRPELDGTDTLNVDAGKHMTLEDVGRGGYSWHSGVKFETLRGMEAGEEMFVSYGPQVSFGGGTFFRFIH